MLHIKHSFEEWCGFRLINRGQFILVHGYSEDSVHVVYDLGHPWKTPVSCLVAGSVISCRLGTFSDFVSKKLLFS